MDTLQQSLRMAVKSIGGNKLRALLTMLGIIIGVMALVILVSLVNGATSSVTDAIAAMGSNTITVSISDDKGSALTLPELEEWAEKDGIGEISASASESSVVAKYGSSAKSASLMGITPSYFHIQNMEILLGRAVLSVDVDNHSDICVINENAASELIGYLDCLGESIRLNGRSFTVVGVLKENESSLISALGMDSLEAYIPYTSLIRLSSSVSGDISSFYVSAETGKTLEEAETAINALLLERFDDDEDAFTINSQNIIEETTASITSVLAVLLGGIAAISLIVGGIGIMNIMLVTVTERTREIGIRKAIGASRGVILQQFLIESVLLCMFGCALGIFFSWSILRAMSVVVSSLGMRFDLDAKVVLIAVLFCFAIGVGFGLYPANKAAKMKPIDALHYGG